MFRVGMKVECVDVRGSACLRTKQVYTCLAIEPAFMRVNCCANPDHQNHRWLTRRFRPIVSRKTSIEIFQRMLTPKQKELAR